MLLKVFRGLTLGEGMEAVCAGHIEDSSRSFEFGPRIAPELKTVAKLAASELKASVLQPLGKKVADPVEEQSG